MPNINKIKERIVEIKIEIFNYNINYVIRKLNDLVKAMKTYYDINNDLLNNYINKNRNYKTLLNINEISNNNEIYDLIKNMNNNIDFNSIVKNIIDIHKKLNNQNNII